MRASDLPALMGDNDERWSDADADAHLAEVIEGVFLGDLDAAAARAALRSRGIAAIINAAAPRDPPFDVLGRLRDPQWVAQQPQHYFSAKYGNREWPAIMRSKGRELTPSRPIAITFDMAPPTGGWKTGGRLRVQAHGTFGGQRLAVALNGVDLEPTADVSEPYAAPWPDGLAPPEALRAWTVPAELLQDGDNAVVVRMAQGGPVLLSFVDVAVQ